MMSLRLTLPLLSLICLLVACGGGGKKSSKPCDVGVNVAGCGTDVLGPSTWGETIQTSQTDPRTNQAVPGSEKLINVAYEFIPGAPARWRRTITVDSVTESLAMFQEGAVLGITGQTLKLAIARSSCDDAASTEVLYYQRLAGSLQIDTQPIAPPTKSKFLLDGLFADIITKAVGTVLRQSLETAFTFGSLRPYLTAGHGSLRARPTDVRALAQARYVCFNGIGPGYSDSKQLPSW